MNLVDVLDELADVHGIESEFVDAHGVVQQTSPETQRALLAALGIPVGDGGAVQAALDNARARAWAQVLPPVLVARSGDLRVPIVVPAGSAGVAWQLTLETGAARAGQAASDELTLLETAQQGERRLERRELRLPADIEPGYHRFGLAGCAAEMSLIVTPGVCWLPPDVQAGGRLAGIAIQLYLLRSRDNWGIGDFGDLRRFVALLAARGVDVVGLNPLHEMFVDDPEHASPYSPASRLLLNVLNIDVAAIPEYARSRPAQEHAHTAEFVDRLAAARDAALVDYSGVSALKRTMLALVYATFLADAQPERRAAFAAYRASESPLLQRTHLFMALREHFGARDASQAAWQAWPADYRDPDSPAVAAFAREHSAEVTFAAWLQWVADAQLAAAADAARSMRVGLYRDLAVGADPAGAETWSNARAVVASARVGAPPDIHNRAGQDWGLPPFHPGALKDEGYRSFIELVRANMRHAGGVRIDHVMALQHLYWIPAGASAAHGAYVRYPLDDLVGIIALESHRARCLVVGEDLGTVPAGFRERMTAANILSYRVLFFEREADDAATFIEPQAYPSTSLAVLGSHDLPTLRAWWKGADIRLRQRLGLTADGAAGQAQRERGRDRAALIGALQQAGALRSGEPVDAHTLFIAAHTFLAATAAALAIAQIDDVTDEIEPVNVPTTSDEHPNWRRRLSRSLEELETDSRFVELFALFEAAGRLRR